MIKRDLKSMTKQELEELFKEIGEPSYRAGQLFSWMHEKQALSFSEMTNLPKSLREKLKAEAEETVLTKIRVLSSKTDDTRKFLFETSDGNRIESVRMKYRFGNSVCISSQAGCRMGCSFCASGADGLSRSLTPSEMLEQIYQIEREIAERVSHVVVMGTGEPFDNYDNLLRFLTLLTSEEGKHLSARNITVSTSGLCDRIRQFADFSLPVNLAVSLHAPTQELRERLMPVAKAYPLPELILACREYIEKTGRRVTFEYSLIRETNDSISHADQLADLLHGLNCHVNLIPVNPALSGFKAPDQSVISGFLNRLEKRRIPVSLRRTLGQDIEGACGMLRRFPSS